MGSILVDLDAERVAGISRGESHVEDIEQERLAPLVEAGTLAATTDYDAVRECDAILIALPTPLTRNREPDLSIVLGATRKLAERLRPGHLVVLESTTYPGTTREEIRPILEEESGLVAGEDFHLAFSPERVDPGRTDWTTKNTPKVVGGCTPACTQRAERFYGRALETLVPVSSPDAAELVKLLENIFRSVNIALVNELAQLCDRLGVDVWEVTEAAATKPFGFMSFEPGPGLGGHCLPVDPFYLAWKAREVDFYTEFIELAGKVNENMPLFCFQKVVSALNDAGRPLNGSRVHLLGVSYKADVADLRESPALKLLELLDEGGAAIGYTDPYVPELPSFGLASEPLEAALDDADCVVVVTAHSGIDYPALAGRTPVCVDFRNVTTTTANKSPAAKAKEEPQGVWNHRLRGRKARKAASPPRTPTT